MQGAERLVPVGFEVVGDEPVVGVDGEVAAAGELGAVTGPFNMAAAQRVRCVGACFELGLDGEGDFERERGDGVQQKLGDGGVNAGAGDGLAARAAALDRFADALVVGDVDAAPVVVAHGHAPPAAPADHHALEQGGTFAGRAGGAVVAVGGGVGGEQSLVGFEGVPGDVAGMGVVDERHPLVAGDFLEGAPAVGGAGFSATAVDERAGVAGVVQGA